MTHTIEIVLDIDDDHPYIDATGSRTNAIKTLLEDMFYDDDYIIVEEINIKED